jgi:hypothetical protein
MIDRHDAALPLNCDIPQAKAVRVGDALSEAWPVGKAVSTPWNRQKSQKSPESQLTHGMSHHDPGNDWRSVVEPAGAWGYVRLGVSAGADAGATWSPGPGSYRRAAL